MKRTNIAIVGYGNLGKACEKIAYENPQFNLVGIFSRRDINTLNSAFGTKFYAQNDLFHFDEKIDVAILCLGSKNDLVDTALEVAKKFNTIDSFDTHAKMCDYYEKINDIAIKHDRLSFVGIGWDPGLFSLARCLFESVLPNGCTQTFWGKGVSQGHSEAIRQIDGVKYAIQYTIPKQDAILLAKSGKGDKLCDRDKHQRECFVVAKSGADKDYIEHCIRTMPNYFAQYDVDVHFVDEETFFAQHSTMYHAGLVMRNGKIDNYSMDATLSLNLANNPSFTASVLMTYALANAKLYSQGGRGAKTILDIPVGLLSKKNLTDIIKDYV